MTDSWQKFKELGATDEELAKCELLGIVLLNFGREGRWYLNQDEHAPWAVLGRSIRPDQLYDVNDGDADWVGWVMTFRNVSELIEAYIKVYGKNDKRQ
jgi:hypothetical protein